MAAPALMDDLIGEILLRVPPDEPAHLVRSSLVCKPWHRLLSDPTFLRQYREFYRTPPLLGFLYNLYIDDNFSLAYDGDYDYDDDSPVSGFVPTTTASPLTPPALGSSSWMAVDCRHGRVLIHTFGRMDGLVVWDPITGDQKQVPLPEYPHAYSGAAVLCAVVGCDHLDCRGGPFLVVFVGTEEDSDTWASLYSSETGTWSPTTTIDRLSLSAKVDDIDCYVEMRPSHLTGDALYFFLGLRSGILKYDLRDRSLSAVDVPEWYVQSSIVMTAEDGALGFAGMEKKSLYLWSRTDANNEENAGWALLRVIELDGLIPIHNVLCSPDVIGFMEGTSTVFIRTDAGLFTLDLKSRKVRKVGEEGAYAAVVPYASFYAPVHATGSSRSP